MAENREERREKMTEADRKVAQLVSFFERPHSPAPVARKRATAPLLPTTIAEIGGAVQPRDAPPQRGYDDLVLTSTSLLRAYTEHDESRAVCTAWCEAHSPAPLARAVRLMRWPSASCDFGMDVVWHGRSLLVVAVVPWSAAHASGLMPGDRILAFDGVSAWQFAEAHHADPWWALRGHSSIALDVASANPVLLRC